MKHTVHCSSNKLCCGKCACEMKIRNVPNTFSMALVEMPEIYNFVLVSTPPVHVNGANLHILHKLFQITFCVENLNNMMFEPLRRMLICSKQPFHRFFIWFLCRFFSGLCYYYRCKCVCLVSGKRWRKQRHGKQFMKQIFVYSYAENRRFRKYLRLVWKAATVGYMPCLPRF